MDPLPALRQQRPIIEAWAIKRRHTISTGAVSGALGDDPQVQLEAKVDDGAGHVRVLAAGANPVAVTFELFVRRPQSVLPVREVPDRLQHANAVVTGSSRA